MALVVGRGRRAVRLVGGHGFLSDTVGSRGGRRRGRPLSSWVALRSTARPLGCLGPRQSRRGVCRSLDGSGPTLSGCGHLGAAQASISLGKYSELLLMCGYSDTREHCGRRPGAWKRRTGTTRIFSLARSTATLTSTRLISFRTSAAPRRFTQELTLPLFRAPPAGSTGRRVAKAAPKSAANKDTLTCCIIVCTRDASCSQSAQRIHR